MSRLTNVEKFAIQGMLAAGESDTKVIAKAISRNVPSVQKYIDSFTKSITKMEDNGVEVQPEMKEAAKNSRAKDLMVTKTSDKKVGGVTMMTGEASAYADAVRKVTVPTRARTARGAIFNIKENKID